MKREVSQAYLVSSSVLVSCEIYQRAYCQVPQNSNAERRCRAQIWFIRFRNTAAARSYLNVFLMYMLRIY